MQPSRGQREHGRAAGSARRRRRRARRGGARRGRRGCPPRPPRHRAASVAAAPAPRARRASVLTSLASQLAARDRRARSGWVSTPTSSCSTRRAGPPERSARRAGVPAKATRNRPPSRPPPRSVPSAGRAARRTCRSQACRGSSSSSSRPSSPSRAFFSILPANAVALERRQVVDEELAVEVIDLVLDADREQPVGVELERLAFPIDGGARGPCRHA